MKKRLLIPLILVAGAGALYALRLPILLHATGWISDFKNPRAPNRPVPWRRGRQARAPRHGRRTSS